MAASKVLLISALLLLATPSNSQECQGGFIEHPQDAVLDVNQTDAVLSCVFDHPDESERFFVWEVYFAIQNDRVTIREDTPEFNFKINRTNGALIITTVQTYHQGVYACRNRPQGCSSDFFSNNATVTIREIVPEAPVITLEGDVLQWNRPDDNGSPITEYQIIAMQVGAPNIQELIRMFLCDTFTCNFNLQEEDFLLADIAYNVRVRAVNGNGEGEDSNGIPFTRVGNGPTSDSAVLIIVLAVVGLVLLIILITIITITVVRLLIIRRRKHDNEHIYDVISHSALETRYNITLNDAYEPTASASAAHQNIANMEEQSSTASHCSHDTIEGDEMKNIEDQVDSGHEHEQDESVCYQAGDDYEQAQCYELAGGPYERIQDYEQQQASGVYDQFKGQDYEQTSDPYEKVQDYEQQQASGAYDQVQSYEQLPVSEPYDQVQSYERLPVSDPYDQVQSYERLPVSDQQDPAQDNEQLQASDAYDHVQSYEQSQAHTVYQATN